MMKRSWFDGAERLAKFTGLVVRYRCGYTGHPLYVYRRRIIRSIRVAITLVSGFIVPCRDYALVG